MKKNLSLLILGGAILRCLLLAISSHNLGYYGGDAIRYINIAKEMLAMAYHWDSLYPPIYPAILSLSLAIVGSPWLLSLLFIGLWAFFTFWFCKKMQNPVLCAAFLSIDPLWLTQTIITGADFLGAVLFGTATLLLCLKQDKKTIVLCGLLLGFAALTKPVYVWTPFLMMGFLLKEENLLFRKTLILICVSFAVVLPYSALHSRGHDHFSISAHDSALFGHYIIGNMLVGQGQVEDLTKGMEEAEKRRGTQNWNQYIISEVKAHPALFTKLFFVSAYKTVFGNANLQIARLFTGQDIEGPGLWKTFAREGSLWDHFKSINWLWILGFVFEILEKLVLLFFAALATFKYFKNNMYFYGTAWVLAAYFAFTPIVFGEPRYFMSGTVILLMLASFRYASTDQAS